MYYQYASCMELMDVVTEDGQDGRLVPVIRYLEGGFMVAFHLFLF